MRHRILLSGILAALLLSTAAPTHGLAALPPENEREAMVRVITNWHLGCSGSTRESWRDMALAWYGELVNGAPIPTGHGGNSWYADGFYHQQWLSFEGNLLQNRYVVDSDFTDKDLVNWGKDHEYDKPDEVDAFMVATHGGSAGTTGSWSGKMLVDELGSGNCGAFQGDMQLGELDLEFLHLSSCVSMDEGDWHPDWSSSFKGLHQADGFHGLMYIYNGADWSNRYRDFADDSYSMPISLAWLDNHYRYTCAIIAQDPIILERQDQCPVARGVGYGQADAINRMLTEQYDHVLDDPVNPTWHHVFYLAGCDPASGDPIAGVMSTCDPFSEGFPEPPAPGPASPGASTAGRHEAGAATSPEASATTAGFADYRAQIDASLPVFGPGVLSPPPGPDWISGLTVATVATAVSDTAPSSIVTSPTRTQARNAAETLYFSIDFSEGRVRYANLDRLFDWDTSPHTGWPASAAQGMVMSAFGALSLPTAEIDPARCCRVDTVQGSLFDDADTSSTPAVTYEAERMVTIQRTVNSLPVMESMVRASVSNSGQISRLLVRWPRFMLPAGLTLRSRTQVLDELAQHLTDVEFGASVVLSAYVAYERAGDHYLPVAVVEYEDGESGEIVTVPLVGTAGDADKDAVPDSTDNCPSDANADQSDRDLDGVGDACDNCPDAPNPGQEDADGDRTGDACAAADGACILRTGECDDTTAGQCIAGVGTYQGDGIRCTAVDALSLALDGDDLSWIAGPAANAYDVVRGRLSRLRLSGGDFSLTQIQCLADDHPTTTLGVASDPSAGDGFFYLVRQVTPVGQGSYDSAGSGQLEGRDLEILASGADCP